MGTSRTGPGHTWLPRPWTASSVTREEPSLRTRHFATAESARLMSEPGAEGFRLHERRDTENVGRGRKIEAHVCGAPVKVELSPFWAAGARLIRSPIQTSPAPLDDLTPAPRAW